MKDWAQRTLALVVKAGGLSEKGSLTAGSSRANIFDCKVCYLLLFRLGFVVTTPFYAANLIETVQVSGYRVVAGICLW